MTRPIFHFRPQFNQPQHSRGHVKTNKARGRERVPVVKFSSKASSVSESEESTAVSVILSHKHTEEVTVDYAVTGGTATGGGDDYTLASGTLTFTVGQVMKTINIQIQQDSDVEANETIIITLSNPANAELGAKIVHTVTVTNDDVTPTFPSVVITSAASSTVEEAFSITITFSEEVSGFVLGDIDVVNGTASDLSGDGTVYTATITPTEEGAVEVSVAEGVCTSVATGGANTASNTLSRTYDEPEEEPQPSVPSQGLGINLPGPDDWNGSARLKMLVDVMKMARIISGNPSSGTSRWRVLTTANRLSEWFDPNSHHGSILPSITGTYLLDFDGGGTVTASGASVTNVVTASGHTTADVVVSTDETDVDLIFSAPVSNIVLRRPGYSRDTTQLTTDEFQTFMAPFSCIRTMNLTNTNWDDEANKADRYASIAGTERQWSERPNRTDSWNRLWGAPLEDLVQIANECNCDLWYCFSHIDSDSYIATALQYINDNLNADLHCYIELSNETWNYAGGFAQSGDLAQIAVNYANAGTLPLLANPSNNQYYYSARYSVKRMIDASIVARNLTGGIDRIRPVISSQYANPSFAADSLNWGLRSYPNPISYYIYGLACAPYIGAATGTVEEIIDELHDSYEERNDWSDGGKLGWWRSMADSFQIKLLMYEAGIDMSQGTTNLDNRIAAAYDSGMQEVMLNYYNSCYSHGVVLACHFLGVCTRDKWGPAWGLTDDAEDLTQAMYLGAVEFAEQDALSGGLTAVFYQNTDFTGELGTVIIPVVSHRYLAWSTSPPYSTTSDIATTPNNQSIRITGKYVVQPDIVALHLQYDANDTASLTHDEPLEGTVDIQIDYATNLTGSGVAYMRLMQEDSLGNLTQVPQSALLPE